MTISENGPGDTPELFAAPASGGQAETVMFVAKSVATQNNTAPYEIAVGQVLFTDPYGHRRAIYEITSPGNYNTVTLDGQSLRTDTFVKKVGERQGIGTYYREGDVISIEEVVHLVISAQTATRERKEKAQQEKTIQQEEYNRKVETGRLLLPTLPDGMAAVIIAELDEDISDSQQDYHGHRTLNTVYLSWSKHTRDLFAEMRKAADTFEPTNHLGTGKGIFKTYQTNNQHYRCERGETFSTEEAARLYVEQKNSQPQPVGFTWSFQEEKIEHREKYSMGSGYYLKDGHSDSNGWKVSKANLHPSMLETLQVAAAEGRLLCLNKKEVSKPESTLVEPAAPEAVTPTKNGQIQLIEYSDKAIAVIGETKLIKDMLRDIGGRFNNHLSCGPGWIFPKSKLEVVMDSLKKLTNQQ